MARGAVDDRLGRALAVLSDDCLGAATPLLRADLRLLAARALAKKDAAAAARLAQDALRDLRRALDEEDPRVAAAAGFVVRLDQ